MVILEIDAPYIVTLGWRGFFRRLGDVLSVRNGSG